MDMNEIAWPEDDAFAPLAKGLQKKARPASPRVGCTVSEKGQSTLSFSPGVMVELGWSDDGQPVRVEAKETQDVLFLRIVPDGSAARVVFPAGRPRKDGKPGRCSLKLGRCGGIELASRHGVGVFYRTENGGAGRVLLVAIPKLALEDAEDAKEPAAGDDDGEAPGGGSPDLKPPPGSAATVEGAVEIAMRAARAAWPKPLNDLEEAPRPVRIAAAVALVEFGAGERNVKQRLSLEDFMLPQREEMPLNTGRVALAALEALRAAE